MMLGVARASIRDDRRREGHEAAVLLGLAAFFVSADGLVRLPTGATGVMGSRQYRGRGGKGLLVGSVARAMDRWPPTLGIRRRAEQNELPLGSAREPAQVPRPTLKHPYLAEIASETRTSGYEPIGLHLARDLPPPHKSGSVMSSLVSMRGWVPRGGPWWGSVLVAKGSG
jgi:hypothetical protein